ncbi:hypothetical protein CBS101457_000898 [Exobasidium rhododendri]|nr:hypothetical protein CBS101457_000898 [Exobasidium rhododendri]
MTYQNESSHPGASSSSMHSYTYSLGHAPQGSLSGSKTQQSKAYRIGTPLEHEDTRPTSRDHGKFSLFDNTPSDGFYAAGQAPDVASLTSGTSQILVASIVQRLVKRLPCNSGGRLSSLEEEELVRSSVANLVIHSEFQLVVVVKELLSVLDTLNKQTSQTTVEVGFGIDVMQSQLFMLQVLVACLIHSWKKSLKEKRDSIDSQSEWASLTKGWDDPPALDDVLAKQILSIMTFYLRFTTAREDSVFGATSDYTSKGEGQGKGGGTADRSKVLRRDDVEKEGETNSGEVVSLAALVLSEGTGLFTLHPTFPPSRSPFQLLSNGNGASEDLPRFNSTFTQNTAVTSSAPTLKDSDSESVPMVIQSIYRQASQVIFFLSSSNWSVIYARIRNRLTYLSTTLEELPSTFELRLLECTNFNRVRLGSVLQELCTSFVHLKRTAQHTIALVLRRSIQAWIQYHPAEYDYLFATGRRMEGGPELLFDQAFNLADSSRKKIIYWPMMTSLLILCPDIISKLAIGDVRKGGSLGKKTSFLEMLRKGLRTSKLSDVAALCSVDLCIAATGFMNANSGLRLLVADLESDLKEKLFDPRRPFVNATTNVIEVPLMVAAFVAFFRLDSQKAIRELVPTLMSDASPVAFKTTLVRSCLHLASEKDRLPWNPPVSLLYPIVCTPLRSIFKESVSKLETYEKSSTMNITSKRAFLSKSKSGAGGDDDAFSRQDLMQYILHFWHIDIDAAYHGMSFSHPTTLASLAGPNNMYNREVMMRSAVRTDSVVALLYIITKAAFTTSNWQVHQRANELVQFCLSDHEDYREFYKYTRESLISCSSFFTQRVADFLMWSESTSEQQHWLNTLQTVCLGNMALLDTFDDPANLLNQPGRAEVKHEEEKVEMALLLTICSADTDVSSLALQLCRQNGRLKQKRSGILSNQEEYNLLYEQLGELNLVQTGRIAQQKRVRACLREVTTCTGAIFAAWKEAYRQWSSLTQIIARPIQEEGSSEATQEKAAQWHNFAGFLAALGGACAVEKAPELQRLPGLVDENASKSLPEKGEAPIQYVESFVQEMVDLLVSDSIWVREKVKETLGFDTSPRLNGILFRMIHSVLSDFFDKATGQPRPSDMYTIFVEHSIAVMQMVLTRMPADAADATLHVDIGALMILLVEYLNALTKRDQAARVRALMCQLCEQLMEKKSYFTFTNELRVRNRLFQVLGGWTTESIEEMPSSEKSDRLQRDLDVTCLRTMSILLDKLPLLLAEDTLLLDDSVEWAKSRQFSTCFNYFIKVLNRARTIEETALTDQPSNTSLRDLVPLKQSAILALSNLLASNINTGLHHSLPLAYQDDLQLRTAFMQIMTNVLNQGTAFDDLQRLTASQKQSKLIELISESDLQLALSICSVCRGYDAENMDYILLNIFDSRGGIIKFLKAALTEEIEQTTSEEMVFRSNSFRTHLLSIYGKTHGYEYLRSIMAPLITEMANKPKGYSFEIDDQRLEPGESAMINQHRLEEMAQAFIDQICSSAHRVPAVLRELCRHIRQLMDRKFPTSRYQGVGGFIFLRFINPAVVAPQNIDINVTGPGKELRRGLLLISKILQTLASNTLFPQHKEPYMTGLNDFLKRNVWKVTTFLDQVSDARTDPDRLLAADQPLGFGIHPFGYGIDNEDQKILHKFFFENIDKIGKELFTRTSTLGTLKDSVSGSLPNGHHHGADGRKIYEHLCVVLSEMGDYRQEETTPLLGGADSNQQALQEFLRRHNGRNVDDDNYRQIFREGPPSKAGRPVYYYTCWHQIAQTLDYEGFLYYVIQVLQPCFNQQFDLVFDCTGMQPNNLAPHQWLTYFVNLLPKEFAMNVRNVIGFNVNTACRLYTRPWWGDHNQNVSSSQETNPASLFSSLQIDANAVFCNSMTELEKYIERRNIALDSQTVALSSVKEDTRFNQITMVWYYRSLIPVTFKISEQHLQITALKPQSMHNGATTGLTNDVFALADIDDVRAISIRGDDNTFFVTCRGGTTSFLFISRDRSEIVQTLRQAKARVSRFESKTANRTLERTLLPSDVPGTLLNMAMLNITSHDHRLRLGAYDLLCALSTSFNFGASNARKRLLSTRGLALSANTMTFVADLSRDFAVAAPGVTLEFLLSFFEGFERATTSQKTACLLYMAPWLSNLVMFTHTSRDDQREYLKRIKEILSHLIAITVKQPEMYATMQRNVWSQMSKLDDLIPILLDVFSEAAMDSGLHTSRFDSVLETMISFASINLRGKLLAKLRRVIAKTAQNPTVAQLHEDSAWKEIATLVRMNMVLSFTSKLESLIYLPELLHIILLLAGNGVDATRHSIHGTAICLIHSLCTGDLTRDAKAQTNAQVRVAAAAAAAAASTPSATATATATTTASQEKETGALENTEGIAKLRVLLYTLSNDESLALFGLPTHASSVLMSPFDASPTTVRETPNNQSIATLASVMYQIVDLAAPTIDTANAWRARLTSLVTSTAFQYNPIIQSRAFILLGCLADLTGSMLDGHKSQEFPETITLFEIDDDLLYQILVSLRGSIQEWASVANDSPIISIVTCLSKVVKILPDKSRYLPQMFWLGISIIQYGHIPLFKSGVELMNCTIKSICHRKLPEKFGTDLLTFLLDGRFEFREEAIRLDDETGVDFESNFGFAMAALLVKGLRHPLTRDSTIELLQCMLRFTGLDAQGEHRSRDSQVSTTQLGFFIALLPTATKKEEFVELLHLAGATPKEEEDGEAVHPRREQRPITTSKKGTRSSDTSAERGLYSYICPLENKVALLVITLMASLLQQSTVSDPEKQQLYGFLADSSRKFPAIVSILYDFLLPNIKEIYLNCQNEEILKSVDVITKVAISEPIFQLQFQETKKRGGAEAYLEESGYACLLDCGTFTPLKDSRRVALAKLSTALLSGLIDAGTA